MLLQDPLLEPGLVLVQGKVPVFGLLQNGLTSADGRNRVYQIGRTQRCAALFALIPISAWIPAVGTGTRNIAIGQESGGLFVVILLRGLLNKYPFIVKGLKNL